MASARTSFDLEHPPEAVFDFIVDPRNELDWQPDVRRVEKIDDSTFEADYRLLGPMRLELTELERPRHAVFLCEGPRMWMRFALDVGPSERGSRVTFDVDMRPKGMLRTMSPLFKLGLPREMAQRPAQIAAALASA
jgi:carbon monoxide dehydrogenase subunit G